MSEFFEYFYIRYFGKVNAFFTTSLDLLFDGNVPTVLGHSLGCAEIEGYLLWVFFSESYVILTNYSQHVR